MKNLAKKCRQQIRNSKKPKLNSARIVNGDQAPKTAKNIIEKKSKMSKK